MNLLPISFESLFQHTKGGNNVVPKESFFFFYAELDHQSEGPYQKLKE